jgi:hypothetical protein
MKITIAAFLAVFTISPALADSTINALSAGSALGGTEQIPMFQTANPAVTTTPSAMKTFTSASPTFTGTVTFPDGSSWASSAVIVVSGSSVNWNSDTFLNRAGVGTLALSDSTTASEFYTYNTVDTVTGPTNYERGVFGFKDVTNVLTIGTQKGGTGSTRNVEVLVGGTNQLDFGITAGGSWTFGSSIGVSGNITSSSSSAGGAINLTNTSGGYGLRNGSTIITSPVNATLQFGASDAASPVAQTIQPQSVSAGNTNVAGATFTVAGSKSNGSGGGDVVFKTTLSSAASGTQNTLATALILKGGTQTVQMPALTSDAAQTDNTLCWNSTAGQLYAGSGTLGICLGTSSMAAAKRDWRPIDSALAKIADLTPGNYFYKQGFGDNGARLQYGFLAENFAAVLPKLARYDADGTPNGIDLVGLIPLLVRAIQEQQAQIEELKRRH